MGEQQRTVLRGILLGVDQTLGLSAQALPVALVGGMPGY